MTVKNRLPPDHLTSSSEIVSRVLRDRAEKAKDTVQSSEAHSSDRVSAITVSDTWTQTASQSRDQGGEQAAGVGEDGHRHQDKGEIKANNSKNLL